MQRASIERRLDLVVYSKADLADAHAMSKRDVADISEMKLACIRHIPHEHMASEHVCRQRHPI